MSLRHAIILLSLLLLPPISQAAPPKLTPDPEKETLSSSLSGREKRTFPTSNNPDQHTSKLNLPRAYQLLVADAMRHFHTRDFSSALKLADKADAMLPPTIHTLNIRGAIAIEQQRYDAGRRFCLDAIKLDPANIPARFNLSEISFHQKNYPHARENFLQLYRERDSKDPNTELLIYKIYLTYLLEGNLPISEKWLKKIPFPSQTPAYQYAHAAWERQQGHMEKWREWIHSAEFIWPIEKRANFIDSLIQIGWLKDDLKL